jgi:hypothetical protein
MAILKEKVNIYGEMGLFTKGCFIEGFDRGLDHGQTVKTIIMKECMLKIRSMEKVLIAGRMVMCTKDNFFAI